MRFLTVGSDRPSLRQISSLLLFLHHELQHIELLLGQAEAIADNLIPDALAIIEN